MARRRKVRRRRPKSKRWLKKALRKAKHGYLHRQLGVARGKKIPLKLLRKAAKAVGRLGRRARLALTMRKFKHKKRRKK